jgi:hypothetical protein
MKTKAVIPRIYPSISQEGLTLRDHFATIALPSILRFHLEENPEKSAKQAYRIADAMMQQREAIPGEPYAAIDENHTKGKAGESPSKQECVQTSSKLPLEKIALTPTEFATLFGRHFNWTYRQIYAGKIKVISNFGRIMIPRSEVDRLLQQREIYSGKKKSK